DLMLRLGRPIPYEHRPACYDRLCTLTSRDYVPRPYPGHMTMFSAAGNSERHRAHWEPLARDRLRVLEVQTQHNDMLFPPHSRLLAGYFDAGLDAVPHSYSNGPSLAAERRPGSSSK